MSEQQIPGQLRVVHDREAMRFVALVDGRRAGLIDYHVEDGTVVMSHTEVRPELRGRGIAGRLVETALREVTGEGRRVDPACPYVAWYLQQHPELRSDAAAS